MVTQEIKGQIRDWNLNKAEGRRRYIEVSVPFSVARLCFRTDVFGVEEEGEQRESIDAWVKRLKKEIASGNFTPTQFGVGLRQRHRDKINLNKNTAALTISESDPFPILDGGHRFAALELLREETEGTPFSKLVDNLPIGVRVYLDGNPRVDFINLQAGKPVHPSHILMMRIKENLLNKDLFATYQFAQVVAELLNENVESPFYHQIRFSGGSAPLVFSALATKGGSDTATSLIGGAKLALEHKKTSEWYANVVVEVFKQIKRLVPDALNAGRLLCPPPNGKKGSASLLVGIANVIAFREILTEKEFDFGDWFKDCVDEVFNTRVTGNALSGPGKRMLLKDFTTGFFDDICGGSEPKVANHFGIPMPLVRLFGAGSFAVPKLATPGKKRGRKPKPQVNVQPPVQPEISEEEVSSSPFDDEESVDPFVDAETPAGEVVEV
jgi:hypothetical protein